ncbi:MAG: tetratricopeptide repeat protein [Candidatus Aminicenantes bacterium]|nr:tetratricopeptide repeat protein [Candidatus Aminicenantes bacterium]NLH76762.1 tetratricopeptide repeat protein [Acidobacteriota bacterium]
MTRSIGITVLAGAVGFAAACATGGVRTPVRPDPAVAAAARMVEADALFAAGHFNALKEARRIYGEIAAAAPSTPGAAEKRLRAAVALSLRAKDLGLAPDAPELDPGPLDDREPALARYAPWLELLAGLPGKIKGNPGRDRIGGRDLDAHLDWINARIADIDRGLEAEAKVDDLAAALRLALRTAFGYKFTDAFDAKTAVALHPASRLVAFQAALSPAYDFEALEKLLASDPGFAEVRYYLGEAALLGGKLLTAEGHYLAAEAALPGSLSVLISLAKVAFQMEETESCLEWNEKALARLPVYRDALLGKGLALGYLARNEEALAVLGRLLELGTYYMGEGHYWSAWNLHELGRLEEARREVDAAKVFLVGVADVATLSGIIAYKQGRLDDAERDLRQALDLAPEDADAAFHLGRLYADRKDWLNSGIYFSGAAGSFEDRERALEKRIEEIEASEMALERRNRLVIRKKVQILAVQATKATAQYNGAAGYHNAGSLERALDLARQAAAHPAFADKAAELIKLILER